VYHLTLGLKVIKKKMMMNLHALRGEDAETVEAHPDDLPSKF